MIADPYPAFNGIAVDTANGLVAMSDPNRKSLLLYDQARGASKDGGISAPLRQIVGPATYLGMIAGVILDWRRQEIYTVNNDIEDTVVVMPYGGSGDAKPSRVFSVPHQSWGLALGNAADQIAVTVEIQNTIAFYRRQVTGVEAPLRLIRGQATGLADPHGIYWDESHDEIGVANHGNFRRPREEHGRRLRGNARRGRRSGGRRIAPAFDSHFPGGSKRRCDAAARY